MLSHLRQWFSNWVTIASQEIIIIIFWCGHIFSCHKLKGGCYWHLGVSDAVDHSVMHRMASTMKNSYAQSVNRAEIEKPCSRPSVDRTRKYTPKTYIQTPDTMSGAQEAFGEVTLPNQNSRKDRATQSHTWLRHFKILYL